MAAGAAGGKEAWNPPSRRGTPFASAADGQEIAATSQGWNARHRGDLRSPDVIPDSPAAMPGHLGRGPARSGSAHSVSLGHR